MINETTPEITPEGDFYAMSVLTRLLRDTFQSIRFLETKPRQLKGEVAVSQKINGAYARAFKAELSRAEM